MIFVLYMDRVLTLTTILKIKAFVTHTLPCYPVTYAIVTPRYAI